ncbi:MAG: hypothetical protein LBH18_00745, partial [Spirochaetaceae bacterium]|nr:hypothetical protein [Spirochaetaceae bacterium]
MTDFTASLRRIYQRRLIAYNAGIVMQKDIAAVAFDVDGTLYPDYRFFLRALPQALLHPRLLAAFAAARRKIRKMDAAENTFYDLQASLCAKILGAEKEGENIKALIS